MTISEIIAEVRKVVEPWIVNAGGTLVVARDPWHAYELIAGGPRGLILVLGYGGESVIDAPQGNPLAQMRIELTLGNGMGLDADTGASQFTAIGDRPALADLLDGLVQAVCAINLVEIDNGTTNHNFLFQGETPVELPNGLRMAAYRVEFNLIRLVTTKPLAV